MSNETSKKSSSHTALGLRFDEDKPRYDLIPPQAITALAELYRTGAVDHGDRNWELGMSWGKMFKSILSHSYKFWAGETYDVNLKTGVRTHHMIAVAWNALGLYMYYIKDVGTDDRSALNKIDDSVFFNVSMDEYEEI